MSDSLFQFLSTRVVTTVEWDVPDAEFLSIPSAGFYSDAGLNLTVPRVSVEEDWPRYSSQLERFGLMTAQASGHVSLQTPEDVAIRLADVLSGRGFSVLASELGIIRSPESLLPLAEAIYTTVSIPVSASPIKGIKLSDLLALAGGIDFQTVHLAHTDGRAVVLGLLTAAGFKIIFGAAEGISYALRHGLSFYLLHWMGVPEDFAIHHAIKESQRASARNQRQVHKS